MDVFATPLALEPSFIASLTLPLALHIKEAIKLEMKTL
jgi:hypothetical protein